MNLKGRKFVLEVVLKYIIESVFFFFHLPLLVYYSPIQKVIIENRLKCRSQKDSVILSEVREFIKYSRSVSAAVSWVFYKQYYYDLILTLSITSCLSKPLSYMLLDDILDSSRIHILRTNHYNYSQSKTRHNNDKVTNHPVFKASNETPPQTEQKAHTLNENSQ